MLIAFDKSFSKSLDKLKNKTVKRKLLIVIEKIKIAQQLTDLPSSKKLEGHKEYYRIRIGDYRLGFRVTGNTIHLIVIAHRKEIYKLFP